jgi:hypothetical protein
VPDDYKIASTYLKNLTGFLRYGKVKPVNYRLLSGGLESISEGFEEMRNGRVRGEKLVCKVGST